MDNGACSYRRYLAGDENAFAEIEELYFEHLTLFINRYVNDIHTAQDIAIDAFAELVLHPQRFRFQTSLKTHLFSIGRNMAINHIRRAARHPVEELSPGSELATDEPSLIETVIRRERDLAIHRALDELPQDMRAVIHLVYFEDLSCEEAARILKKNRKQIYNLLYRAKEELRSLLGKDGNLFYD